MSHRFSHVIFGLLLGIAASAAHAADILYTWDNPGDGSTGVVDNITSDGAQNSYNLYYNSPLATGAGPDGSTARFFPNTTVTAGEGTITNDVIAYPNQMTWSALVKPTQATDGGVAALFWSGWRRGVGESGLQINADGNLTWFTSEAPGPYTTATTTSVTPLVTLNVWHAVGITFDGNVGGGTVIFYVDGLAVQSFGGLGSLVNNGNAQGNSETDLGIFFNVGGAVSSRYIGYMDNAFIAGRTLSPTEMVNIQALPEPTALSFVALTMLMGIRRRPRRPAAIQGEMPSSQSVNLNTLQEASMSARKQFAHFVIGMVAVILITFNSARASFQSAYDFESPSSQSSVIDSYGNYNGATSNLVYGNGYGPTLTAAAAKFGASGLDFTNDSTPAYHGYSYLNTQSSSIAFTTGFTFATWMKQLGNNESNTSSVQLFSTGQYDTGTMSIYEDTTGNVVVANAVGFNSYQTKMSASSIPLNQWTHLAVTWDSTSQSLKIYINGVLDATQSGWSTLNGGNTSPSTVIKFGGFTYGSELNGYMDNVYFSDAALSQAQVQLLLPEPSVIGIIAMAGLAFARRWRRN
jgi:hypothetical protein